MCRIGGRLRSGDASPRGANLEIPPLFSRNPNLHRKPVQGQCLVGSLTGAVASQNVTEALKGSLSAVGNRAKSVKA
jgi:hypothetical protein